MSRRHQAALDHFDYQADAVKSPEYNQTLLRIDFVDPMFSQLGLDMDNRLGYAEQYREVVHEDKLKVGGATEASGYGFRVVGLGNSLLEAKDADTYTPPRQPRRKAMPERG